MNYKNITDLCFSLSDVDPERFLQLNFYCSVLEELTTDAHPSFGSIPYIARPHPTQMSHTGQVSHFTQYQRKCMYKKLTGYFSIFSIPGETEEVCAIVALPVRGLPLQAEK